MLGRMGGWEVVGIPAEGFLIQTAFTSHTIIFPPDNFQIRVIDSTKG